MPPAARVTDTPAHPLPPLLGPGPGSLTVLIGFLPAWRGVPAAAAAALSAAKQVSDAVIQTAEAATLAAAGADIHMCVTPLPVPPHGPGVVIDGSKTVLINNLPACRMGA